VELDKIGRKVPRRLVHSIVVKREVLYGSILNPLMHLIKLILDKKNAPHSFRGNAIKN
tara:strand:+ start:1336 stop:1509 length:174 start_codon:yes stop_codon:yes gene_type:complete